MKRRYKRVEDLEGEQEAAARAQANSVVAAGAGSGKTTVLAARYVHLLESGRMSSGERILPRNILVLTFTRKAAAEMYGRIYGSLEESAALARARVNNLPLGSCPPGAASAALARARAELAAHLDECLSLFSQAQISTFDSFASRIARSGSARFGMAPDFEIDAEAAADEASSLALAFLLAHREDESIRELVSAVGLEDARDEVLVKLALDRMPISSPPDFASCHAAQADKLERMLAESRERFLAMRAAVLDYSGAAGAPETTRKWLDAMARDPGESETEFSAFLSGFAGLRKPASNWKDEASQFLSDAAEGIKDAIERHRGIADTAAAHPARLELYKRLDDFREEWDARRRAAKSLSFRDVAQLAYDTLVLDRDVRRYYQGLYRYVMIDEFQDDDELQKRILYLVAARPEATRTEEEARGVESAGLEPDKLFFVGDEKQSIYLFRGADVSVFRRLASELAPSELAPGEPAAGAALSLSRNYRSEPGVIGMINAIFPTVMASLDPERGHEDFEARFDELASRDPTPGVKPLFVYLEAPRRDSGDEREGLSAPRDPVECEAWEIARIVRDAVESGSFMVADRKEKLARPARYEDFALLMRSTGNQVHFEKYFRLFGVPYGSENACGLFSEAVACDLYYALRLALYPDDRNAFAAYLRSPFAGLSDESVVRLLIGGGCPLPESAAELDALRELVDSGERRAFGRAQATLSALASMVDREPIARCLCWLWFEAGYRAALLRDPVAAAFEEHFELLHSKAIEADERGMSLAAFVAELELLVGKPDKQEIDLPRESSRGVRIMTVHKSKGLEFPVVIIPQANNSGQDRAAREAWYWEEGLGPTFKPPAVIAPGKKKAAARSRNAFFEDSRELRSAMDRAELKRLLYVALTRAESHIIVSATKPFREDREGKSFRSLLDSALGIASALSEEGPSETAAPAAAPGQRLRIEPFGELCAMASGALVGTIPERSELEYLALVSGARSGSAGAIDYAGIATIERGADPSSSSVTALSARYEERPLQRPPRAASQRRPLDIPAELAAPEGVELETWGSLVHAQLEAALGRGKGATKSRDDLIAALEDRLGSRKAAESAAGRAQCLAAVFLESELGARALASEDRRVELKIAIALDAERGPRYAKGSIDLAFVENGKIVVVDYKTDGQMIEGAHAFQVAAYERAASEIFGLEATGWLFYLYGGGVAVPVAADESAPRLEDALDAPLSAIG